MRTPIRVTAAAGYRRSGDERAFRLEPGDLTPQMRDEFTDLYRRWRSEQQ